MTRACRFFARLKRASILKRSLPHLLLKDRQNAIDLFFELLEEKERREILQDLMNNEEIELPNFGIVGDSIVRNNVDHVSGNDLDDLSKSIVYQQIGGRLKEPALLDYDEINHKYRIKDKEKYSYV